MRIFRQVKQLKIIYRQAIPTLFIWLLGNYVLRFEKYSFLSFTYPQYEFLRYSALELEDLNTSFRDNIKFAPIAVMLPTAAAKNRWLEST